MFYQAHMFNSGVSDWDVSLVTSMNNMFNQASIFNKDISSWDVSSVINMASMFRYATQFGQQMCEWNLEGKEVQNMFEDSQCTEVECVECPSS